MESATNQDAWKAVVALMEWLYSISPTGLLIYVLLRVVKLERRFESHHRLSEEFISSTNGQLSQHKVWADVTDKLIEKAPTLIEGATRLLAGLQELSHVIAQAGGIKRIIGADRPTPAPKEK